MVAGLGSHSLPGLPARGGIQVATVRGGLGGIEPHGPDATTVWFAVRDQLVAVDVFGMSQSAALRLVDDLQPRADGAGFEPDPGDNLRRVAETPARPATTAAEGTAGTAAGSAGPATARLVFGDGAVVVTNVQLAPGHDDLLTATAGSFGTLDRWGDHDVLVDTGLDGGATSQAWFVDPDAGVLVTVRGPTGELQPYVEGLERVDEQGWDRFVAEHSPTGEVPLEAELGPSTSPTDVAPTDPAGPTSSGG
jgi:hypothetical protein